MNAVICPNVKKKPGFFNYCNLFFGDIKNGAYTVFLQQ